jgi:hypothetical protein
LTDAVRAGSFDSLAAERRGDLMTVRSLIPLDTA